MRLSALLILAAACSVPGARARGQVPPPPGAQPPRDSIPADSALDLRFNTRIEGKQEKAQNLRCAPSQLFNPLAGCRGGYIPSLGVQFDLQSRGWVGNRFLVDIDFDSRREFDASNSLSVRYFGRPGEKLRSAEIGNVFFSPPPSRFITSNVPSGNHGAQAIARFGRLEVSAIAARQRGTIVRERELIVGDRTMQPSTRRIEDYQVERLRFFFTVDPALFAGRYPNIDILDRGALASMRMQLPDTLRPSRVLLYRFQYGAQPQNPNGPRFRLNEGEGVPASGRLTYDLLRDGVDYVMDPSLLWFALVRPLNPLTERLVVAYYVNVGGQERVWPTTGGTPDIAATQADQVANLVWDPNAGPLTAAFRREIRSVYRIGGEEVVRPTTQVRIVTGAGDQERPVVSAAATFLQMLGLAQRNNDAAFDAENRLWPRLGDPVLHLGSGAGDAASGVGSSIMRDLYLVFPSLRPFAQRDSGLIVAGNAANPAIYTTPAEYLDSPLHPPSVYRLELRYEAVASLETGSIALGAVQLRPGSERITVDDWPLVRDRDYRVDYLLGRITFIRPDTLFPHARPVKVRYEENPIFASTPTSLAGIVSELPFRDGALTFTAFRQSQSTPFTRPQLGFEANAMIMAGATANYSRELPALTRLAASLPFARNTAPARLSLRAEIAASQPQTGGSQNEPYVHSFEDDEGFSISLTDTRWYLGSLPAYGDALRTRFGLGFFEPDRAGPIAWQTNATGANRLPITFSIRDIDPLTAIAGIGFTSGEQLLWLTLHPLSAGGLYDAATGSYAWTVASAPAGRRFRSVRTVLSPSGADLSRTEHLEFWTLVDTSAVGRSQNPTLVLDLGDVSENSLAFGPETMTIRSFPDGRRDTTFTGKQLQGFDRLDSERDPFTRIFNVAVDDRGLPGDVVDRMTVDEDGAFREVTGFAICRGALRALQPLGDTRTNCTVGNGQLDEEDIDLDLALNFPSSERERERILRYVVDLSDPARFARFGGTYSDTYVSGGQTLARTRQWVLVRVPIRQPDDSLGDVQLRRIRALRLTMISGGGAGDDELAQIPIARLRATGAPWLRRDDQPIRGAAGDGSQGGGSGYVIVSRIGTTDSSATIAYQPPPGIANQADLRGTQFQPGQIAINEHSLRVLAGGLDLHHRAEAFYRFPAGEQNFMAFQELRLWARGRNSGWGTDGELQMFVKLGRDASNFYMYRAPAHAGSTPAAWEPEIRVSFDRFLRLRETLQREYLSGASESIRCTGVDSALVAASPVPAGGRRFAACSDGYIVYTIDPAATPPNLYAVQEMAAGIVRVGEGTGTSPILPGDTLELWIDDIRLSRVVSSAGYAGEVGADLSFGDIADLRVSMVRRDPHFRQLGEQPSFVDDRVLSLSSTVRLEKLLPQRFGLALPLTVVRSSSDGAPLYLRRTDIRGAGVPGLREPRNVLTTWALTVRRAERTHGSLWDEVANNLSAVTAISRGMSRGEYHDARQRRGSFTLDYTMSSDSARGGKLPWWLDRTLGALPAPLQAGPISAIRGTVFRLNPSLVRLSSGIDRSGDRRRAYLTPGSSLEQEPRTMIHDDRLWRNAGTLELRPTAGLTLRWDALQVRDMRAYGDSNPTALAATRARQNLAGLGFGFERERAILSQIAFAPAFSQWFRPRIEVGSQYSLLRDPNRGTAFGAIQLPGVIDTSVGDPLPRRVTMSQTAAIGTSAELGRALTLYRPASGVASVLGRLIAPVDVRYDRTVLGAWDDVDVAPRLMHQLGWRGTSSYRLMRDRPAAAAGLSATWIAAGGLNFPGGFSLGQQFRHTDTRNWVRRAVVDPGADAGSEAHARVDGSQRVFPNASLRWNYRAPGRVVEGVSASVGYSLSHGSLGMPGPVGGAPTELRRSRIESAPVRATINWGAGRMGTSASYVATLRTDSLPGTISRSRAQELRGDLSRVFTPDPRLAGGISGDIRVRGGAQHSRARTFVSDVLGTTTSRLQDNGRTSFDLSADTDVSETMLFTIQASRVITFDNNLNRRFAQTVFSTVLEIRFFGGEGGR